MNPLLVLVHSPLVGPFTWSLVDELLHQRDFETLVPVLTDVEGIDIPLWQQHAEAVKRALGLIPQTRPLILVGHSGAGPLLPAIRQVTGHPVTKYIFVDAGLPHGGKSRLAEMEENSPDLLKELRPHLEAGGRFPEWSDEELREVIPHDRLRRAMLAELHPRSLAFFLEPLPIVANWPDAPCAYMLLSPAYRRPAEQARQKGWAYRSFDAGHFHMLMDPAAVTRALIELIEA